MGIMAILEELAFFLPIIAVASVGLLALYHLFYIIRRQFSIKVNCWFCNTWSVVKYDDRNSFECPSCLQYNGFTSDGDYNKDITAQYECSDDLNTSSLKDLSNSNGLCCVCNEYQSLRVQQLAKFSPKNEKNFHKELEIFKKELDNLYKLCPSCEKTVKKTIQNQNKWLLGLKFLRLRQNNPQGINVDIKTIKQKDSFVNKLLKFIIVMLALVMLATIVSTFSLKKMSFKQSLPYYYLEKYFNDLRIGSVNLKDLLDKFQCTFDNTIYYIYNVFGWTEQTSQSSETKHTAVVVSYYTSPIHKSIDLTVASTAGLILQIIASFLKYEGRHSLLKLLPWTFVIFISHHQTKYLNNFYTLVIEAFTTMSIIYFTISYNGKKSSRKTKKHAFKRLNTKQEASFEDSFSDTDDVFNISSSSKKSFNSNIETSSIRSGSKPSSKLFGMDSSFAKFPKNTFENITQKIRQETAKFGSLSSNMQGHLFGKEPVFVNNLYRSTNSPNVSMNSSGHSIKQSMWSSPPPSVMNYSFKSGDFNDIFSVCGDKECDNDLPSSFSKLRVDPRNDLKVNVHLAATVPSVYNFKTVSRPKPVLTPPKLVDIHKTWSSNYLNPVTQCNLSRSSSQTSGFVSEIFNGHCNSLPPSRNGSPHKEFDRSSLLSEPAYHMNSFMTAPSMSSFRSYSPF